MSRLIVAALVLLLTVAGLFGASAWNRGGDVQTIVLTERELALPWNWPAPDAAARLRLEWQQRNEPQDARLWLTEMKLRELGFATGVPAGAPEAEEFYGRSLPRLAWVAFELDGPQWKQIEQRRALTRPSEPERHFAEPVGASRLVPIDAATSAEPLRRRHQGASVVVLPAVVAMRYRNVPNEGPSVWAVVEELVAHDVAVPMPLRGRLPQTAAREAQRETTAPAPYQPRYEVVLRVGRLGALWVQEVRRLSIGD